MPALRQGICLTGRVGDIPGDGHCVLVWWGHSPRPPHCHRSLRPHSTATTLERLTTMGHHVPMARPPVQNISPPCPHGTATNTGHLPPPAIMSQSQATSLPQSVVSPWHGHGPGHHVPRPCPYSPAAEPERLHHHPGAAAPYGWGQHPRCDPGWRPRGGPCPYPQARHREGVQHSPPSHLRPPGDRQLMADLQRATFGSTGGGERTEPGGGGGGGSGCGGSGGCSGCGCGGGSTRRQPLPFLCKG